MAVYTKLTKSQIKKLASKFNLQLKAFAPIQGGACNSNYLLKTKQGRHMLTIVEERSKKETIILCQLLLWLEKQGYPTTRLRKTKNGNIHTLFIDKPVLVKKYLKGNVITKMARMHVEQIGMAMAQMHLTPLPGFLPTYLYYEKPVFKSVIGKGIDKKYEKWLKKRLSHLKDKLPKGLPKGLGAWGFIWGQCFI